MPDIDVDIVGESSLRETENGWEKERTYKVRNLDPGTLSSLEHEALQYVPLIGSPHESIPISDFVIRDRSAVAESGDMCTVTVQYRTPGQGQSPSLPEVGEPPQIEVGGRVTRTRTNVDRNGAKLKVAYSGDSDFEAIPENVATVDLAVPQFTATYVTRETTSPDAEARRFVGKVNGSAYKGQAANKWLCEAIIGRSNDGGQTYLVRRELGFREGDGGNGWSAHIFAKDSETGEIPASVTEGDGEEFYEVYDQDDFSVMPI